MEDIKFPKLPQWLYELLRWVLAIVSPALITYISAIAPSMGWTAEALNSFTLVVSATTLFLGAIFGIGYIGNKEQEKPEK